MALSRRINVSLISYVYAFVVFLSGRVVEQLYCQSIETELLAESKSGLMEAELSVTVSPFESKVMPFRKQIASSELMRVMK